MKTDQLVRSAAATSSRGRLADFVFVGVGIVPLALLLSGQPAAAMLLFIPLLFAGCLFGMWEQVESAPDGTSRGAGHTGGAESPAAAGVNLRRRLP